MKKLYLTLLVWGLIFTNMLLDTFLPLRIINSPAYYFTITAIIILSIFAWFLSDTKEIGFKPSAALKIGVIFLAAIAVPFYRFKYTGFKKGLLFIIKILGIFLSILITIAIFVDIAELERLV